MSNILTDRETPLAKIVGQMSLSKNNTDVLTQFWAFMSVNDDLTKLARCFLSCFFSGNLCLVFLMPSHFCPVIDIEAIEIGHDECAWLNPHVLHSLCYRVTPSVPQGDSYCNTQLYCFQRLKDGFGAKGPYQVMQFFVLILGCSQLASFQQ